MSLAGFAVAAETANVAGRAAGLGSQAGRPGLGSVWLAQMASYDALAVASAVGRVVPGSPSAPRWCRSIPGTRRYSRLRLRPPRRPPVAGVN